MLFALQALLSKVSSVSTAAPRTSCGGLTSPFSRGRAGRVGSGIRDPTDMSKPSQATDNQENFFQFIIGVGRQVRGRRFGACGNRQSVCREDAEDSGNPGTHGFRGVEHYFWRPSRAAPPWALLQPSGCSREGDHHHGAVLGALMVMVHGH